MAKMSKYQTKFKDLLEGHIKQYSEDEKIIKQVKEKITEADELLDIGILVNGEYKSVLDLVQDFELKAETSPKLRKLLEKHEVVYDLKIYVDDYQYEFEVDGQSIAINKNDVKEDNTEFVLFIEDIRLPLTLEGIDKFLEDNVDTAYENLIEDFRSMYDEMEMETEIEEELQEVAESYFEFRKLEKAVQELTYTYDKEDNEIKIKFLNTTVYLGVSTDLDGTVAYIYSNEDTKKNYFGFEDTYDVQRAIEIKAYKTILFNDSISVNMTLNKLKKDIEATGYYITRTKDGVVTIGVPTSDLNLSVNDKNIKYEINGSTGEFIYKDVKNLESIIYNLFTDHDENL